MTDPGAGSRPTDVGRIAWRPRLLPALVLLGYLLLQVLAAPAIHTSNDNDTYRYARSTLQILGFSRTHAQARALASFCASRTVAARRSRELDPVQFQGPLPGTDNTESCIAGAPHGITPNSPRYEAIFDSRPGYPLLAAPFTDLLGLSRGLYLTSVLLTALGGALVYVLLRSAGLTWRAAILGQVLYYVTPIGTWGSQPLSDGTAMALTVGALLGAWWMTQRRPMLGAALLTAALAMGFFVRYSSFLMVSAALALAGLIALWRSEQARKAGTCAMVALNVGWVAAAMLGARFLRWPGMGETLQDTFTRHFEHPDVSDPGGKLVELNLNLWGQWLQAQMHTPWLFLILGVSVWALARADATLACVVILVAATGLTTVAVHPVTSQQDRLMVALWLIPVVGLPILASTRRGRVQANEVHGPGPHGLA